MADLLLLTDDQIAAGAAALTDGKLSGSMVADLVSIFRGYLGDLAVNYPLEATLAAEDDNASDAKRCAKLAACLSLFQENQFTPLAGFAPTAGNRTGFVYSMDGEVFEIFRYAFGLFWDIPAALTAKAGSQSRVSTQGAFIRRR